MKKTTVCLIFSFIILLVIVCMAIMEICCGTKNNEEGVILKDGHEYYVKETPDMSKQSPLIFHDKNRCKKCRNMQ